MSRLGCRLPLVAADMGILFLLAVRSHFVTNGSNVGPMGELSVDTGPTVSVAEVRRAGVVLN